MSPRVRYLFLLLALVAAAVCIRLGVWQRDRLHQRRGANTALEDARRLPPLDVRGAAPQSLVGRRVVAHGRYDHAHEMLIRHRTYQEHPGVYVITPLLLAGSDTAILVNRGFLPSPDGLTVPALDSLIEPDSQRVSGIAFGLVAEANGGEPLERGGRVSWRALDSAALRSRLPYPILNVVLLQSPDSALPNFPRRVEPRPLDDGPHLSYMLQWFAFAVIFAVGGVMVALGRRVPEWSEPTAPAPSATAPPRPPPA